MAVLAVLQANSEPFVLYVLGKLTTEWLVSQGQHSLVPAFNGFQVRTAKTYMAYMASG